MIIQIISLDIGFYKFRPKSCTYAFRVPLRKLFYEPQSHKIFDSAVQAILVNFE